MGSYVDGASDMTRNKGDTGLGLLESCNLHYLGSKRLQDKLPHRGEASVISFVLLNNQPEQGTAHNGLARHETIPLMGQPQLSHVVRSERTTG